ncbi:MAG: glycosidase [Parcubacteria group bacterium]|nr:glycosidase [Parcubacteria group bacterium]
MVEKNKRTVKLKRAKENPIIVPDKKNVWENKATFNPAAIYLQNKVHIVYRAMSEDNTSVFGYATSQDGIHIDYRSAEPIYIPKESFEQKLTPGGNSGAEDPRLTIIGDRMYMCYAAFDGKNPPRVALTHIAIKNFLAKQWIWAKPVLISPPDMDDKDAFVFPEKIKGKYMIVHRGGDDIDLGFTPTLDFKGDAWIEEYRWIAPRKWWWDSKKVGAAAPPLKTSDGWVMLYHGISEDNVYRIGAVLLDLKNPVTIIGRTDNPIFEPETSYEKEGQMQNVVFPCGNVLLGKRLFMYYGGADKIVGVATIEMAKLIRVLKLCKC